jgi:hypothetical protein
MTAEAKQAPGRAPTPVSHGSLRSISSRIIRLLKMLWGGLGANGRRDAVLPGLRTQGSHGQERLGLVIFDKTMALNEGETQKLLHVWRIRGVGQRRN